MSNILMLGALIVLCVIIGWTGRGLTYKTIEMKPAMAYGFEEQSQVWNRVRVNDKGQVVCAKE